MALFYIEMGQGVVAKPELRVTTSAMHSCTLIAGYSTSTGMGGAYHYPAEGRGKIDVDAVMDEWIRFLRPTRVTLIFSGDPVAQKKFATTDADREALQAWVRSTCEIVPSTARSNCGRMSVSALGAFSAGDGLQVSGDFASTPIDLSAWMAGEHTQHGGFRLFGSDIATDARMETLVY